jgi:hypothetical protein
MESLSGSTTTSNFWVFVGYGILIFLYLVILRLLLNFIQQLGQKYRTQKSVVDVDIHRTMTPKIEDSMIAFDPYSIAMTVVKGAMAIIGMAIAIIILVLKLGVVATGLILVTAVLLLWAVNHWLRQRDSSSFRHRVNHFIKTGGNAVSVTVLVIALAGVAIVLVALH